MALPLQNLAAQFAQNRSKSMVLLVLACIMGFLVVRSLSSNGPRTASALPSPAALAAAAPASPVTGTPAPEMDPHLAQSKILWDILHETRGLPADQAFTFDPAFYTLNAAHKHDHESANPPTANSDLFRDGSAVTGSNPSAAPQHQTPLQEQAAKLQLQSVIMGPQPVAVINSRILRVGDRIADFHVVLIQPRQVLVSKDGQTVPLKMAE